MSKIGRYTEGFGGETVRISYTFSSTNSKTGDVIQQWITPKSWERDSHKDKLDTRQSKASCNECPLMKGCYVKKGMAGMGLKSGSKSKNFKEVNETDVLGLFRGEFIRFGAFGEPVLAGRKYLHALSKVAKGWTGYTHQWRDLQYHWSNNYLMASVEDARSKNQANSLGYRTFRIGSTVDEILEDEVLCPASKEAGKIATCEQCGLCKGRASKAKNIFIVKH